MKNNNKIAVMLRSFCSVSQPINKDEALNKDTFRATRCVGFTLIELLVVVLIIGILSAIALPQYTKSVEKARMVQIISNMNALEKAIEMYYLTNGYEDNRNNLVELLDIDITKNMTCSNGSCTSSDGTVHYNIFGEIHSSGTNGYYVYAQKSALGSTILLQAIKSTAYNNQWKHYCFSYDSNKDLESIICPMYLNN